MCECGLLVSADWGKTGRLIFPRTSRKRAREKFESFLPILTLAGATLAIAIAKNENGRGIDKRLGIDGNGCLAFKLRDIS